MGESAFLNRMASAIQMPLKTAKNSASPPVMLALSQMPVTVSSRALVGSSGRYRMVTRSPSEYEAGLLAVSETKTISLPSALVNRTRGA